MWTGGLIGCCCPLNCFCWFDITWSSSSTCLDLPRKNSAQIRKQERTYHPTNGVYMSPAKFICCGHGSSISWLRHRPALGHCAIFSYRTLLLSSLAGHRNGEPAGDVLGTARSGARQMHTLFQTVEPSGSVRGPY